MSDPAVSIRDLVKHYDRTEALRGISFDIHPGELFGFLGPNGAGKTTTLSILAGLIAPTSGSAHVMGYDVRRDMLAAKRCLGYIPDRPYVYEKLTGWEIVHLFADLYGVPKDVAHAQGLHWLGVFGLSDKADALVEGYSHGMRQRLVLAATFLHDPEVLVLDEPLVGLDPQGAHLLKRLLRQRCEAGKVVLISTHTLHVAEETCDRVCVMDKGKVVSIGTVAALRRQLARADASLEELFLALTRDEAHL